ncbi:polar amino acid transport system substrate-binding protein [Lebetimonas natsushimae]|uniref:Polar amino acid transport system substrate-binding protein n=1 Tax=Lebetimonas natsushimae TaxID=1936991 RepID=A0A292YEG4_9BACT|nr:transporter substrate-binding domain-containing protein [Lebetimonas natsushimae]GAX87550.1 polar amino acid transport system substrate-binding protein [Lebetimonas natsushimae]
MKTFKYFLLILILMFSFSNATNNTKPFYYTDDEDYPPLIYRNSNGKPAGILYDIMKEAFHRMNIPLKVDLYPWKRAQKMVKDGISDAMISIITPERLKFTIASDPILLSSEYIFVNKNNPHFKEIMTIKSIKELKPFTIVEAFGAGWTKANLKGCNIIWVPNIENAFEMLIKGRADIYIANGYTARCFIHKKIHSKNKLSEGYKNIVMNHSPIKTVAFRLLINKNSKYINILDKFNKVINQMKMDGTIASIIEKHGFSDLNNLCIKDENETDKK